MSELEELERNYQRVPWMAGFPEVFVHAALRARDGHEDYVSAKSGDAAASLRLVRSLLDDRVMDSIRTFVDGRPVLLAAVAALEATGFNAIPDVMASEIATRLGLELDNGELRQVNKVVHTKASGWHRFVTQAEFGGEVQSGALYLIVDDHVGLGGTLANMRGYIETRGGQVLAMTTLTETRDARRISLEASTLDMLRSKHGQELEDFWRKHFGYGIDCCTELEAGYLHRQPSFDAIRRCLAEASEKARARGIPPLAIPDF